MLVASIFVLVACMSAMLYKVIVSRLVGDRMLAASAFNTFGVVLITAFGVLTGNQAFFVDVSLVYACIGLVSAIGFSKFFASNWE
ncbi:MAG: monovalent cation/H+ antiporter complex subunit F [Anaplasma ovis]|uniref:Cation:proton antiporter n=1 Tax=Anaplasma ovis str. Haibei TaxID=1248439 RepID=A0A2Z2L8C7_9RICK|nr:monovalent cation/H+ antiporter complex subunit F [Anaplasma ovis]ASI47797.1 cation:proton antiporter [Anaplasma ovis str. Haibei]